jgi:hypothetical protein
MPSSKSLERLLDRMEAAKREFGSAGAADNLTEILTALDRRRFPDARSLIRFHEALLFFRAYPSNARILRLTDRLLASFPERIALLRRTRADLEAFEQPDVSGISGTGLSAVFTYDMARWLARHHSDSVDIDWDGSDPALLGPLLSRLHPNFAEDALVEANIPFLDWFRAAKGKVRGSDLRWLISRLERVPLPSDVVADLYAHAELALRWDLDNIPGTRTNLRLPGARRCFYHSAPLLRRADVSLDAELKSPPIAIAKLSHARGQRRLDLARETSALRFRELHGFTYGDPSNVYRAELGRGVEVFVAEVLPEHRLPVRTYHAGMFFKNAVPVGYIETLTFRKQMEVGFNLYYTFREGETAWLYSRLLRLFQQLIGVTLFTVDPYQLGLHNEEAIESGAFWFYRKLGFRPTDSGVAKLLVTEEKRLRVKPDYRTPTRTLRRLAAGWMVYGTGDRVDVRHKIRDSTLEPLAQFAHGRGGGGK